MLASGQGLRFGGKKQIATFESKTLLEWTLRQVEILSRSDFVVIVSEPTISEEVESILAKLGLSSVCEWVPGGTTRAESIQIGLTRLSDRIGALVGRRNKVFLFDANRPLTPKRVILELEKALDIASAACPTLDVVDGVAEAIDQFITNVPARNNLVNLQTPEAFILEAYLSIPASIRLDPSTLGITEAFVRHGQQVLSIQGDPLGKKITFSEDLKVLEMLQKNPRIETGEYLKSHSSHSS